MAQSTSIEWTRDAAGGEGATWNPVTGCGKVSPGCAHCYAEAFAERFRGVPGHPYQQGFDLRLWPERLELPLRWRRPRLIFANSMSDLFHEEVPDAFVHQVFAVMERASRHTFQVLTKRHERLAELAPHLPWPPNVWMGVSIENRRFVHRADHLRQVPAAVRFISAEPLLGALEGLRLDGIDWLIAGGESGHRARPLELAWVRELIARCRAAGVACFVKQLGTRWAQRGKGGDPAAWPADMRVREMPASRTHTRPDGEEGGRSA
jgi:protein gp37